MSAIKDAAFILPISFSYLLVTLSLLLWCTHWYFSRRHLLELAKSIPGPKGLPIIGNALQLRGTSSEAFGTLHKFSSQFKNLFKIWFGPRLIIILKKPEDIEMILSSHVHLDKSVEYDILRPWLGNGLLTSTGKIWRAHRKLIAPTFHTSVLKTFIDLINKNSQQTIKKLKTLGSKTFDCHEYMCEATVEILLETVMGVKNLTAPNESMSYATSVIKLNDIIHYRHTKPWLKPNLIFNLTENAKNQTTLLGIVHGLSSKILNKKKEDYKTQNLTKTTIKEEFESNEKNTNEIITVAEENSLFKDDLDIQDNILGDKKRKPFLDSLIDSLYSGNDINEQEVKEQVDTILFEGHDTTGAGSSFFLCLMGIHQNVQDKIVKELNGIFGNSDRPVTFADTFEMKYLERCILETLRLYPPVPLIARQLKQDLKLVSGNYTIPAGCTVTIGTYWLHHDPQIFPDPYKFNPDHHLPENAAKRHYYSFIPFSAGPRSCVGRKYAMLKLKILLSTILRNFRIYSDSKEADFRLQADIILKREEGFQIRLEPRTKLITSKV